ncbi:MAG: transcription termination/antitermination protein NusG [Planctomycetes bacterium]|nr:transcription termination/antitermination protein NusG [Planctomycetota bacterium]
MNDEVKQTTEENQTEEKSEQEEAKAEAESGGTGTEKESAAKTSETDEDALPGASFPIQEATARTGVDLKARLSADAPSRSKKAPAKKAAPGKSGKSGKTYTPEEFDDDLDSWEPETDPRKSAKLVAKSVEPQLDVVDDRADNTKLQEIPENAVWEYFAVSVQPNMEEKVRDRLKHRISLSAWQKHFGEILIPTDSETVVRGGKKRVEQKKSFPGYIIVEMVFGDDTWHIVQDTSGVTNFVGSGKPAAMDSSEIDRLKNKDKEPEKVQETSQIDFLAGDSVKIKEGPFENFEGSVEEVNSSTGMVRVVVTIFGRATNLDLNHWQLELVAR